MVFVHSGQVSGVEFESCGPGSGGRPALQLQLCGIRLDHLEADVLLERVRHRLTDRRTGPLAIGSINLDHIHHFGDHRSAAPTRLGVSLDWEMVIDGTPVARRASAVTGLTWPRLPGADLLPDLLGIAEREGVKVGFLGGHDDSVSALRRQLAQRWPELRPVSFWTPPRSVVDDYSASAELASEIARDGVDLLIVGLGKPRQERWIEAHGVRTGARVLGGFGAAADFLAGAARRAPAWMRRSGCEWVFRLVQEPRRLARRYLVDGPAALRALRRATPIVTVPREQIVTESVRVVTERESWPPAREPSPRW